MTEYEGLIEKMDLLGKAIIRAEMIGTVRILEGRTEYRSAA